MPSASFDSQELSPRALLTGVLLGALLLGCRFWKSAARLGGSRDRGPKESSISQTAGSAAASIVSRGLVAPIPAHASITGESLDAGRLIAWVFSVSSLEVWVGWYLRPLLIERGALRLPAGLATLETLQDILARGHRGAGGGGGAVRDGVLNGRVD